MKLISEVGGRPKVVAAGSRARDGAAASPDVLDFERLLRPISADAPAGPDLRAGVGGRARFDAVRAARRRAADCERRIARGEESASPDWTEVSSLAEALIERDSKDLEVVVYLIEALVRGHGLAGLRDGFRLAADLIEGFWDGLPPMPDEEGLATRVAALGQLSGGDKPGTVIGPIDRIPLTDGGAGGGRFNRLDFERASELESLEGAKRESRLKDGWVSLEAYRQAVAATPVDAFDRMAADLAGCAREFARLCAGLDERCHGPDGRNCSPPTSQVREALERCRMTLAYNVGLRGGTVASAAAAAAATEVAPDLSRPSPPPPLAEAGAAGAVTTRVDAVRALREVAGYLRAAEPHTPVIYLVEKAARWVETPLPALLAELIDDAGAREQVFRLAGIPRESDGGT